MYNFVFKVKISQIILIVRVATFKEGGTRDPHGAESSL